MLPCHKKAQMEFVGLAIVILMIILGGLFLMRFSTNPLDTTRQDIANIQLSNNFLSTLLESQADCGQHTYKDLLQDIAQPASLIICENGDTSIKRMDIMTKTILDNTLKTWKKSYELKISIPGKSLPDYKNPSTGCSQKRIISPRTYPIAEGIVLELKICD